MILRTLSVLVEEPARYVLIEDVAQERVGGQCELAILITE